MKRNMRLTSFVWFFKLILIFSGVVSIFRDMRKCRTFYFSSFTRYFWSVFVLILFTQLNWLRWHHFNLDVPLRMAAVIILSLVSAPVIHFLFSLPFFFLSRQTRDFPGLIAGLLTPFYSFAFIFFYYFSPGKTGYLPYFYLKVFVMASFVLWFLGFFLCRKELLTGDGEKYSIKKILSFYADGFRELFQSTFFPPKVFNDPEKSMFPPLSYPLLIAQLFLLFIYGLENPIALWKFLLMLILSVLSLVLFVHSVHFFLRRKNQAFIVFMAVLYALYFTALFYHANVGEPLDFSLLYQNRDIVFTKSSFLVYKARLRLEIIVASLLFLVWCLTLQRNFNLFSLRSGRSDSWLFPVGFVLLLAGIVFFKPPIQEEFALFTSSFVKYLKKEDDRTAEEIRFLRKPFPYASEHFEASFKPLQKQPDVFIIVIESFSQLSVQINSRKGKSVTPFFDSLIPQGLYASRFYGNSVQTSRGLWTILTGVYESVKDKTFLAYRRVKVRALPAILSERGYRTVFFNAHRNPDFDQKRENLLRFGFDDFIYSSPELVSQVPKERFWNWGIQDDEFYKLAFSEIDRLESADSHEESRKPFFGVFLTLSQHPPHFNIPQHLRFIEPNPTSYLEHFMNAQYLSDLYLKEFFKQLASRPRFKDSIIIITGDHAYPLGVHGVRNESGYFEENFRVPFLILWKGHIKPGVIGAAHSQIDIAPTLLDVLGIDTPHHFIGKSLVSHPEQSPFCLMQPYDKRYLVGLDYPWKYVRSLVLQTEFLYDLEKDPGESLNLASDQSFHERLEKGRSIARAHLQNQILLDGNRIWDDSLLRK